MDCLDKIIKLSRTDCECFDTNKPEDFNEGQTEIYLDEIDGLDLRVVDAISDCATGNLWELMEQSRTNAIERFTSDVLACLDDKYVKRRKSFTGVVGRTTYTQNVALTPGYVGVRLDLSKNSAGFAGGEIILKRIGLLMNAAQSITVYIYNNIDPAPLGQYTINSATNQVAWATLNTPLRLPTYRQGYDYLYYYIVYQINGTFLPKNNGVGCGCGKKIEDYETWFGITGWKTSLLANLNTSSPGSSNAPMNGLLLDMTTKCKTEELICGDLNPLDLESNGIHKQYAYAVRFKAAEMLIEKILSSPNINRFTMLGREHLYGKRATYRKSYEQWVEYICAKTDISKNDCLKCNPREGVFRQGIMK